MQMKRKNPKKQKVDFIDGLSERHASQIIRRKMMSKIYKDKTKYDKNNKNWKAEL
jgi:hypothetical protein